MQFKQFAFPRHEGVKGLEEELEGVEGKGEELGMNSFSLCELKASPGIPSYLDDWDVTLFKLFDLSVYNLYWFLDEMEFIINLNFF
ncbi:hypothetical protein Tco_0684610 [Tanacetum coccineum]